VNVIKKLLILTVAILLVGGLTAGCTPMGGQAKGWSGMVMADDTLFLGSMEGKIVAISASGGTHLWLVTLETSSTGGGFGCAPTSTAVAVYGTPAVSGELVYVGGYNGKISALNSASGALRWVYPREGNFQPIVGGAVVASGNVYFGCADGKVYALDADTGDKNWEFPTGDKIWSTPAIDGDTLYIGSFDKKLYAIDAITGKAKWEQPYETQGVITGTPLVYNNTVYVGSFDRHLYAVDTTDGSLRWRSEVEADSWFWAKPVIANNTVYAPCLDGKVYVLDAQSGREIIVAIDLKGDKSKNPISSSPVLVDNAVIIATEEGKVYTLDTSNNQESELRNLEQKIFAPLYANDGVIYVHTQEPETLHALNMQTGVEVWPPIKLSGK